MESIKRVVILGHNGFVGKHLENYFKKENPNISVIGKDLPDLDLTKEEKCSSLKEIFDLNTAVVMCSGIKKQQGDNVDIFSKNLAMAINICKLLETNPVRRFIFFSSAEVYGSETHNENISEETPVNPTTHYGLAKYASEELLRKSVNDNKDSSLVIIRPPLIYGPGDQPCYGPSAFVAAALSNKPITVWGDGTEKREFIFVEDIAKLVYRLTFGTAAQGIFNAAAGKSHQFTEVIDIISSLRGKKPEICSKERTKEKVDQGFYNQKLLLALPNFSFTSLSEGLQKTLEFQRQELDKKDSNTNDDNDVRNTKTTVKVFCRVCQTGEVNAGLNFGLQPVSTRFLQSRLEQEYKHSLSLGICEQCALVQLLDHPPVKELKPHFDWIAYIEPEAHLDSLAEKIEQLLGTKEAKIAALSYKDDSLLERMRKKGFINAIRLHPSQDLGINSGSSGTEAIQEAVTLPQAQKITHSKGKFDLLIVRHIVEHAYDFPGFMNGVKELLTPTGLVLFEVPDYSRNFETLDYSSIWEEHLMYFTPETFQNSFALAGFSVEYFHSYHYTMENCLVAVIRKAQKNSYKDNDNLEQKQKKHEFEQEKIEREKARAMRFFEMFPQLRESLRSFLSQYKKEKGNISVFGAGHTADLLINVMGLEDYLTCVIDDNENKKKLFMPGSKLPIQGSSALLEENIKLCLFCLNPEIEEKIKAKNGNFLERGGEFSSLSPASKYSLFNQPLFNFFNKLEETKEERIKIYINNFNQNFSEYNKEVYYPKSEVVKVGKPELELFKQKAEQNERKRSRICTHPDKNDQTHEMLIVLGKNTYIRPHKHLQKSESFHIIEGSAKVVIFDDQGKIKEVIGMGEYHSGRKFYYRLNSSYYHTVIITSPYLVFHETTKGPFERSETIFAPWSPEEDNPLQAQQYLQNLLQSVERFGGSKNE